MPIKHMLDSYRTLGGETWVQWIDAASDYAKAEAVKLRTEGFSARCQSIGGGEHRVFIREADALAVSTAFANRSENALPRCAHGAALRDGAGEALEPPCGCRP